MSWSVLLSALGFLVAGAALGYASLAAGPLPAATSAIFLVLLLARFRRQPEQPGAYMVGGGLVGAVILFKVLSECSPPSCHYQVITPIVGVVFILVAIGGAVLLARAVMLRRFSV